MEDYSFKPVEWSRKITASMILSVTANGHSRDVCSGISEYLNVKLNELCAVQSYGHSIGDVYNRAR